MSEKNETLADVLAEMREIRVREFQDFADRIEAAAELGRRAFGFEIKKDFFNAAKEKMLAVFQPTLAFCDDEKGA